LPCCYGLLHQQIQSLISTIAILHCGRLTLVHFAAIAFLNVEVTRC
jgi:hypothetical protein